MIILYGILRYLNILPTSFKTFFRKGYLQFFHLDRYKPAKIPLKVMVAFLIMKHYSRSRPLLGLELYLFSWGQYLPISWICYLLQEYCHKLLTKFSSPLLQSSDSTLEASFTTLSLSFRDSLPDVTILSLIWALSRGMTAFSCGITSKAWVHKQNWR